MVIGDITTVHDTGNYVVLTINCCLPGGDLDPRCLPIYVPDDDLHLRSTDIRCLNLTRAYTYQRLGCVPDTVPGERVNAATPMLDASFLYGTEESGASRAREYSGGRLKADNVRGKELPPSGSIVCINNQLPNETRCHNGGYDYLKKMKVIFPSVLHVDDYDETLEPRVSIEYVITNRWFHSVQEGRFNLYDRHGKLYNQLLAVDLTLRTGILFVNNTLEGLTQGTFRQACAANDYLIDPDMGERVLGPLQRASDVMSSDIMKGRDMGLPPYNEYRKLCKLPVAKTFHDLYKWMPVDQVNAIRMNYESVDDVDLMAGIIAERPMPDVLVGPTLACIMTEQLLRWRRADRFWYESPKRPMPFTKAQMKEIRRFNMAKFVCDYGDQVDAIQPHPFFLPGPGNPITDCSHHEAISLEPWRDQTCVKDGNKGSLQEHTIKDNPYNRS
ncbi:peroxidase-like [Aphomia sociella]